jgi:predicted aspartyl protease
MRTQARPFLATLAAAVLFSIGAPADDLPAPTYDPVLDADAFAAEALLAHPPKGMNTATRAYLAEVSAAGRLDFAGTERYLKTALHGRGANPQIARRALVVAGGAALSAGHYSRAADWLDMAISQYGSLMSPQQLETNTQGRGVAMALRNVPAQTIEKQVSATIPLSKHVLGFTTAPSTIEGHPQTVVLDTGTNISAMSQTAAKMLGVHMLTSKATLSSATSHALETTIAIADTVTLGPATLHHVVFLVVDDAILAPLGPDKRVDVIIGMQVLASLGRVTFRDDKPGADPVQHSLVLAPSRWTGHAGNLRMDSLSPFVRVKANNDVLTFFVDGGARKSSFDKRYAREYADRIAGLERKSTKTAGAGGVEERQSAIFPTMDFSIDGKSVTLANVPVDLTGNGSDDHYGSIGIDVLWAKGGYTFDFGAMSLTLGN